MRTMRMKQVIVLAGALTMTAACASHTGENALGGAAIGAATGAAVGAATGGSAASGALIGGAVGAGAGAYKGCREDPSC